MHNFSGELDRILHQPIRTKIMAYLIVHNSCDFNTIKKLFNLSDGHMTTHMRELLENNYVEAEKSLIEGKTKTIYSITSKGSSAFKAYVNVLKNLVLETSK